MSNLQTHIENYLKYCEEQKRLDNKTLKAYKIDLTQFNQSALPDNPSAITSSILENFICELHKKYKPKTVKRKIASIKALFHYFEYRDIIDINPFSKVQIRFREPTTLPKTIPLSIIESFLSTIYMQRAAAKTLYQRRNALRDAAVIELLFATGIRISELCLLRLNDVRLDDGTILIFGKGSKERILQIGNDDVISILTEYKLDFVSEIGTCGYFFVNQAGHPINPFEE